MSEPRNWTDNDAAKRLKLRLRVKRGVVAGYIHEISVHQHRRERPAEEVRAGQEALQRA
jgi:hypothetical protein